MSLILLVQDPQKDKCTLPDISSAHEIVVMCLQGVHLPLSISNLCLPHQLLPCLLACAVCIQHVS